MLMLLVTTQVMGTVRDHRHYAKKGQPPPPSRGSMSSTNYVPRNKNKKKPTNINKNSNKPPPPPAACKQVYNKTPKKNVNKTNRTMDLFRGAVSKLLTIGRIKLDRHNVAYSPMMAPVISIKKL